MHRMSPTPRRLPLRLAAFGALALAGLLAPGQAQADSIDGNWCHQTTSRRLQITGAVIVTPAGTRAEGDYGRHDFSYVVPARDPGAGGKIDMQLMGENLIRVTLPGGGTEMWDRCGPAVS